MAQLDQIAAFDTAKQKSESNWEQKNGIIKADALFPKLNEFFTAKVSFPLHVDAIRVAIVRLIKGRYV